MIDDPKTQALLRSLEHELLEHNEFFDMLVDMIPSKLYVAGTSGDDYNPKYLKGSHKDSKQARKAANKEAKRRKLDPTLAESTVQTKARMMDSTAPVVVTFPPAVPSPHRSLSVEEPGLSRIEVLKKRLHEKIKEKQGSRPSPSADGGVSKRAARRAEKLRRREEANKRSEASKSAVDKDQNHQQKYKVKEADRDDPALDLKRLDFGRLAGFQTDPTKNYLEANKALGGLVKNKNLQKMLTEAEDKKQKLESLKDGTEEEKERAKAIQWKDVLKEADGVRIRDDTTKIKKALKRKAASKAKSQKAWKSRMDQQQEHAKNRQAIRNHNLKQRKRGGALGANLSKKRIVDNEDKGSGRLSRAGFEGKKQGFLNGSKD